jgi:thiamine biosynthesis lipoprotein
MTSGAVATSADYHASRQFRARNRHPLVSTRHRGAARLPGSVSVFAADCMTADALTKVACTAPDRAPGILQRFGAEAIVITGSGLRHVLPAPAAGAA